MKDKLIVSGIKAIKFLIENPKLKKIINIVYLFKTQKLLIDLCEKNNIPFEIKEKNFFDTNFGNKNKFKYKYANAVVNSKKPITLEKLIEKTKEKGLIVMLDHLQDPFNLGAILRTCVAMNVSGIIIPKNNQAPLNHNATFKASQGYALNLDVVVVSNLYQSISTLKKSGYWIYATNIDKQSKNFRDIEYNSKSVLILGCEGNGVSPILIKSSDFQIHIPMSKDIDSLNVSVAAGIILSEMSKNII